MRNVGRAALITNVAPSHSRLRGSIATLWGSRQLIGNGVLSRSYQMRFTTAVGGRNCRTRAVAAEHALAAAATSDRGGVFRWTIVRDSRGHRGST